MSPTRCQFCGGPVYEDRSFADSIPEFIRTLIGEAGFALIVCLFIGGLATVCWLLYTRTIIGLLVLILAGIIWLGLRKRD